MASNPDPALTDPTLAPLRPTISVDQVQAVARLARLALTPDEALSIGRDLAQILSYFSELQAVDVTGVAPMTHPLPFSLPLRVDQAQPPLARDVALAAAPLADGETFVVPKTSAAPATVGVLA